MMDVGPVVPHGEAPTSLAPADDYDLEVYQQVRQTTQIKLVESDSEYSKIHQVLNTGKRRVVIPLSFFQNITPDFPSRILNDPFTYLPPTEAALGDVGRSVLTLSQPNGAEAPVGQQGEGADYFLSLKEREARQQLKIGISGWLGSHGVTPRGLNATLANKIVCVEGVVTRCATVRPELTHGTFYVPELQRHFFREAVDNIGIAPKVAARATKGGDGMIARITKDSEGRSVELEHGLSFYRDLQRVTIQEMPEITPTGQLPRAVDVVFENDLVDSLKPGDRCRVYGVLRVVISNATAGAGSGVAGIPRMFIVANNVELLPHGTRFIATLNGSLSPNLLQQFHELASKPNTLSIVASSIAPSISGNDWVKRGLALQMVGGITKTVEQDGTNLRGNIHVLLVGDPSCGKSQMLRYVVSVSPLALSTTGRGSSAVGLTAAVISDQDTGERRLEAGAMVLADQGIVCIDEFDKMSAEDRVAVHEVMEQQRVSINKAGISAVLNARTSVLAAANPIYGLFDDKVDFSKQINFPDSLLSRFDLIYLIRESNSAEADRHIASRVLAQLRVPPLDETVDGSNGGSNSRNAGSFTLQPLAQPQTEARTGKAVMWTRLPHQLANQGAATGRGKTGLGKGGLASGGGERILTGSFLTQYLQCCRQIEDVELTEAACEEMAEFYSKIRERLSKEKIHTSASATRRTTHARAIPTPRLIEACIRLATAHAKLKLKKSVEVSDVKEAVRLLRFTLCGEETDEEAGDEKDAAGKRKGRPGKRTYRAVSAANSPSLKTPAQQRSAEVELAIEIDSMDLDGDGGGAGKKKRRRAAPDAPPPAAAAAATATISDTRSNLLADLLRGLSETSEDQEWDRDILIKLVNKAAKKKKEQTFDPDEFDAGLKIMQKTNRVMIVGKRVYWI